MYDMNIGMVCAISFATSLNIFNSDQSTEPGGSKSCANTAWTCKTIYVSIFSVVSHNTRNELPIG